MASPPPLPSPITRLYRVCDPNTTFGPEDSRYVNCDDVRGENLARDFDRSLGLADPLKPEIKVFAGHRGVGKTTELLRLKRMLERSNDAGGPRAPFQVIYFDVITALDVNDLDFPDLLVFTTAQVQRQMREANIPGFSAVSTLLKDVWEGIKSLLDKQISFKDSELEIPFTSLTLELRNRPNARKQLREAIERQSTRLLDAVNDRLQEANVCLWKDGKQGLVLLIDGLDKLVRRSLDGGASNTHDRLFLDRSEQLASLKAHTIYTVPISMLYSPRTAQLEQTFGEHNVPVPMIRLRDAARAEPKMDSPGMQKMREILQARCASVPLAFAEVFDSQDTEEYLYRMTGGHPRHLMMFTQAALITIDDLPITRRAVEKAVGNYANSLLREIPDAYWPKLRIFAQPQDDVPKDSDHQEMLYLLHIFEYMNGRPWYEVNPVLRTLPKFNAAT